MEVIENPMEFIKNPMNIVEHPTEINGNHRKYYGNQRMLVSGKGFSGDRTSSAKAARHPSPEINENPRSSSKLERVGRRSHPLFLPFVKPAARQPANQPDSHHRIDEIDDSRQLPSSKGFLGPTAGKKNITSETNRMALVSLHN